MKRSRHLNLKPAAPTEAKNPRSWCIVFMLVLFCGCSVISPDISQRSHEDALRIARYVQQINSHIKTCKGTGNLVTEKDGRRHSFRIAFAIKNPDHVRITMLSSGYPVETMIADGEKVIFKSHTGQHDTLIRRSNDTSLSSVTGIPVKVSDIIQLLSGKVPLLEYRYAENASGDDAENDGIILKQHWGQKKQVLSLFPSGNPASLSRYDHTGELLFTLIFNSYKTFGTTTIASRWSVTDAGGSSARLEITSFQADIPIKDRVFMLTEP